MGSIIPTLYLTTQKMLPEFTPCDIVDNLRDFQQRSLFTDLAIYCTDGSMSAHKVILAQVLQTLGLSSLDVVDGLVLPDTPLAQVDRALACLYREGNSQPFTQICTFFKL